MALVTEAWHELPSSTYTRVNALTVLPPPILTEVLSMCSPQCLSRVEVALGSKSTREEVCDNVLIDRIWAALLAQQAGMHIALPDNFRREEEGGVPRASRIKAAFRSTRPSLALAKGWRDIRPDALADHAAIIAQLDGDFPDGRQISDPGLDGRARRLALHHFDVSGCFANSSWNSAVDGFLEASHGAPRQVSSQPVYIEIDGTAATLRLTLEASDRSRSRDVICDLNFGIDLEGVSLPAVKGRRLQVESILCCSGVARQSASYTLEHFDATGFPDVHARFHGMFRTRRCRHFWSFGPNANRPSGIIGHVARLEIHCTGETVVTESLPSTFEDQVGTAEWNVDLLGSAVAPLFHDASNAFADRPFPPGSLDGVIALVLRGGSSGFAQKASTVQAAGAVGCVICRDDNEDVTIMSRTFQGKEHPSPRIPSLIVDADVSKQLLRLAQQSISARIMLDRSRRVMRQISPEFRSFQRCAELGEPLHLAVLIEEHAPDQRSDDDV